MITSSNCEPMVYSIKEAVRVSNLGKTRIYQLIKADKLRVTRIGRRTLVNAASLHDLLESGC